jgi:hypothetical protein
MTWKALLFINEKLTMVYANAMSWHSLETPIPYLSSNQELPIRQSDCRNDSHNLCWKKNTAYSSLT